MAELLYYKTVEDQSTDDVTPDETAVNITLDKWGDIYVVVASVDYLSSRDREDWRILKAFKNKSYAVESAVDIARMPIAEILAMPFATFDAALHY